MASERTRRYTLLVRIDFMLSSPLTLMPSQFARKRSSHTWSDFMMADGPELKQELLWAASRKGTLSNASSVPSKTTFTYDDFRKSLVPHERRHLDAYEKQKHRDVVFSLAQNPLSSRSTHSTKEVLHCIIRNSQLIFVDGRRWLTARELLAI